MDILNIIYAFKKYDEVEGRGWRYFFKLGFLDGKPGLVWHFLQGGWYRFLVDAKINEIYHLAEQMSAKRVALSVKEKSKREEQEEMKKTILEILEKEYGIQF